MSRIYNLKPVVSRTSVSVPEGKLDTQLRRLKVQQQEFHVQPHNSETEQWHGQPHNQMIRIQAENQQPETKQNQVCSQETQEEPASLRTVQSCLKQLKLKEGKWGQTAQLTQCHQRTQQKDQQFLDQTIQSMDEETCHMQKTLQPLQPRNNQKTPSKLHQLNQSNSCTSFTVNPHSSTSLENPPKSAGQIIPAQSAFPSASPSPSSSLPLFSLRNSAKLQNRRGNTITINPKKSGAGPASAATPAVTKSSPAVPSASPNGVKDKGKKRYPTVEEIEVIGGYQMLEKSCLAKSSGTQKTVKVCFDEAELEWVFEYPSESSVLASFPSLPLPGPEGEEEKEEVDDEDDEEDKGAFLRSSKILGAGRGRVLRVDESCRR
ncbi:hypothetical protein AGOR_G00210510 [Albula goreensis]|uniref:Phostensin/Taperin PP1-binding domain-containing protein n=1 Tax=Albula goreensis TaxID=1534307 RepID=A0A8T3CQP3_9TELE|nr:hypothetical protein AGOR_G00210510 [Albula goreensis]